MGVILLVEKLVNEYGREGEGQHQTLHLFTSWKMLSFSKPLRECKLDKHYKIGQALKLHFNKRCPYAHTLYYADGKHQQWLYFIVIEEVQRMPPIKEFYGPLMRALDGDAYESDENVEFSRQMFQIEWENKAVAAQMLSMVHFAEQVRNKQGVTEDFWDVLAPVISGSKFNFQYLGAALTPTPTPVNRMNSNYVGKRGHGKSPCLQLPVPQVNETSSDDSGKELSTRKKEKKAPPFRVIPVRAANPYEQCGVSATK